VKRKWDGTSAAALEKHGGRLVGGTICFDDGIFAFNWRNCALCQTYQCKSQNKDRPQCPLEIAYGSCPCTSLADSLWHQFTNGNNPQPMIDLIAKAIAARDSKPKESPNEL